MRRSYLSAQVGARPQVHSLDLPLLNLMELRPLRPEKSLDAVSAGSL